MIKIKIQNTLIGRNEPTFRPLLFVKDMLREYSIDITESNDYDYEPMKSDPLKKEATLSAESKSKSSQPVVELTLEQAEPATADTNEDKKNDVEPSTPAPRTGDFTFDFYPIEENPNCPQKSTLSLTTTLLRWVQKKPTGANCWY